MGSLFSVSVVSVEAKAETGDSWLEKQRWEPFARKVEECLSPQVESLAGLVPGETLNVFIVLNRDGYVTEIEVLNKHKLDNLHRRAELMSSLKQTAVDTCSPFPIPEGLPEDMEELKIRVPFKFVKEAKK